MTSGPAPTDQRAGIRPITFILDDRGQFRPPVTLPIRPEDLSRNESSRATVHQTLGRDVTGWVDNFGEALPSCTISGHTGWRYAEGTGMDGFQSFEALNQLVQRDYHAAKQAAIDAGGNPSAVRLLFVDALDNFAWSVVPTQFVLRRSKSRPLLFQYNITLQALATTVDVPMVQVPDLGNPGNALISLKKASEEIDDAMDGLELTEALLPDDAPLGLGDVVGDFVDASTGLFDQVGSALSDIKNLASGVTNELLTLAGGMAQAGLNAFRTITSAANLPLDMLARAQRIATAYNEVACVFQNALRPRTPYEEYSSLYGSSNCSSTTGGRGPSIYAGQNVFNLMLPEDRAISASSAALLSISALRQADPVLAPLSLSEVGRNLQNIVEGVSL